MIDSAGFPGSSRTTPSDAAAQTPAKVATAQEAATAQPAVVNQQSGAPAAADGFVRSAHVTREASPAAGQLGEVMTKLLASHPAAASALADALRASPSSARELAARGKWLSNVVADPNGPLRHSLPVEEQKRRLSAIFDLDVPFAETLSELPNRPTVGELPRISPPGDAQAQLDAEPLDTRLERSFAFRKMDRMPLMPLDRWAVEGDRFVRQATRDATLLEGLSFGDINKSRPMSFFRAQAAQAGSPDIDLNATGAVQAFEVPPTAGLPPMEIRAVLPRPFVAGRPTIVYMTEATSAPFDATGKPIGTIGEFLGDDMKGLGEVNVVLVRSPYQAEFPNGPRFTAGYDNVKASLAYTTQYLDGLIKKVRDSGSGPVIMGGYSLGGAYVNQYRGWFDDGKSGADFYIPMAAPAQGYGGLFDPSTANGRPTWWSASQLAPVAYKQQKRIARELSPTAAELERSKDKVFALVPRMDEAIQGIDEAYGKNMEKIPGGHISGAVEPLVELTVQILGKPVTIPNWPAMGTVARTHAHFRSAVEAYLKAVEKQ